MIAHVMVAAALVLTGVRLLRGPTGADRVVALDLATTLGVGLAAAHAVHTGEAVYLDVALVVGLIGFLGTVGLGLHLTPRRPDEPR
ncbi:MAG: cation:proton antiporter [Myxococcales bacterium]|nr:pesticidal protein Cry22Aa [Myxococcales bacterium]MCB9535368.1 cation:proton antiporter [Myxococcales bacterium]